MEDPQNQADRAVTRTAPFAGLIYALVVLWYAAEVRAGAAPTWPTRPWYRTKATPSFVDMLTTLRCAGGHARIVSPPLPARRAHNSHIAGTAALLARA
jgi:hypothetical protein